MGDSPAGMIFRQPSISHGCAGVTFGGAFRRGVTFRAGLTAGGGAFLAAVFFFRRRGIRTAGLSHAESPSGHAQSAQVPDFVRSATVAQFQQRPCRTIL